MTATGKADHEKTEYENDDQDGEQNSRATTRGKSAGESLGRAAGETAEKAGRAAGENFDKAGRAAGENFDKAGRAAGETFDKAGRAAGETFDKAGRAAGETLDKAHESLAKLIKAAAYPATGSIESFIFRMKLRLGVKQDGKTFSGNASSIATPGGGALFGDVYTDDIDRLYNDTVSFTFESTPVYLSMQFFDQNSRLLGHLQSGAVSTVAGAGGGRGSWS
jgi:hypothetical protein